MAARQVVIVHGWSDRSESFEPLAAFLKANGFDAVPVWLGDYPSREDDVRIEDVARRMDAVIRHYMANGRLSRSFDMIVHSTGGLVARQWVSAFYPDGHCPMKRLVMLAPANFGSVLAHKGRSFIGRIVKGFDNWFETGRETLNALELASPFQHDLAWRDLFAPADGAASPYGPGRVMPFVIAGTHPFPAFFMRVVNEDGGDGTVRAPAANLNACGMTIDFSASETRPVVTHWKQRHGDMKFPLAVVPDRSHSSVYNPDNPDVEYTPPHPDWALSALILRALACEGGDEYARIAEDWLALNEDTRALAGDEGERERRFGDDKDADYFHQYLQIVACVVDDFGVPVDDYFLEFFAVDNESEEDATLFHSEILEHVHTNRGTPSRRCLYIDRTDLMDTFYPSIDNRRSRVLRLSISADPPGPHVRYFASTAKGAAGNAVIHAEDEERRWLKRNATHFIRIVIPRHQGDGVFTLREA
jgi:pimeloyl-ACP methyl ester carboxylesterase